MVGKNTNTLHNFTTNWNEFCVMKLYEDDDEQWINENCVIWKWKQNM